MQRDVRLIDKTLNREIQRNVAVIILMNTTISKLADELSQTGHFSKVRPQYRGIFCAAKRWVNVTGVGRRCVARWTLCRSSLCPSEGVLVHKIQYRARDGRLISEIPFVFRAVFPASSQHEVMRGDVGRGPPLHMQVPQFGVLLKSDRVVLKG